MPDTPDAPARQSARIAARAARPPAVQEVSTPQKRAGARGRSFRDVLSDNVGDKPAGAKGPHFPPLTIAAAPLAARSPRAVRGGPDGPPGARESDEQRQQQRPVPVKQEQHVRPPDLVELVPARDGRAAADVPKPAVGLAAPAAGTDLDARLDRFDTQLATLFGMVATFVGSVRPGSSAEHPVELDEQQPPPEFGDATRVSKSSKSSISKNPGKSSFGSTSSGPPPPREDGPAAPIDEVPNHVEPPSASRMGMHPLLDAAHEPPRAWMQTSRPRLSPTDPMFQIPTGPSAIPMGDTTWVNTRPWPMSEPSNHYDALCASGVFNALTGGTGVQIVDFQPMWARTTGPPHRWQSCVVTDQYTTRLGQLAMQRADGPKPKAWANDRHMYHEQHRNAAHIQLAMVTLAYLRAAFVNNAAHPSAPHYHPLGPAEHVVAMDHLIALLREVYDSSARAVSIIRVKVQEGVDTALLLTEATANQHPDVDPNSRMLLGQLRTEVRTAKFKNAAKGRRSTTSPKQSPDKKPTHGKPPANAGGKK